MTWERDSVVTDDGVVVPVRATSRRPTWADLPAEVRHFVEDRLGSRVVTSWSAGTGFTAGFASRLTLASGASVFVKAASSVDDRTHGWGLSDAYREEVRKLRSLPADVGAAPLLWHVDEPVGDAQWLIAAFVCIDGRPPRRPWRVDELALVLARLAEVTPRLTPAPSVLGLRSIEEELVGDSLERLESIRDGINDRGWLDTITRLCAEAAERLRGDCLVHMDLRDDNVLIDASGAVWFVDWNWPVVGAPWVDTICLLLSARGDGLDVEAILAEHPLTRAVDPADIDALLGVLWPFWAEAIQRPVPRSSPHLRDHQRWYLDVTRGWLEERLASRR